MKRKQNRRLAQSEDATKPKQGSRKSWFKRLLERIAKAHEQSGGQLCAS